MKRVIYVLVGGTVAELDLPPDGVAVFRDCVRRGVRFSDGNTDVLGQHVAMMQVHDVPPSGADD